MSIVAISINVSIGIYTLAVGVGLRLSRPLNIVDPTKFHEVVDALSVLVEQEVDQSVYLWRRKVTLQF
jgi:hypothetical protein